ncbi:MAG TPA: hypothetical protein VFF94_09395, partial [Novosphingobium sp.]|nr:hypothetical protein [Novosphingobium sp.]
MPKTPHAGATPQPARQVSGNPGISVRIRSESAFGFGRNPHHAHVQTTIDLYGWVREDEALKAAANWKSYAS